MSLKRFSVTIDRVNYEEGVVRLVKLIKPNIRIEHLKFRIFDGGLTNMLIGCWEDSSDDIVLLRVYGTGTEAYMNRDVEANVLMYLNEKNMGSRVYCRFNNGICYEYIHGQVADYALVQHEHMYSKIAKLMAQMHLLDFKFDDRHDNVIAERKSYIIELLYELYKLLPDEFNEHTLYSIPERIQKLPSRETLKNEIDFLVDYLVSYGKANNSKIVFSHNDILLGNIIYDKEKDRVSFIDYEYSGYNYQGFDIANHFNRFGGTDNTSYNLYPNKDYQFKWLRIYLEEYYSGNRSVTITSELIESLYKEVNKLSLLSHLTWGVWSIVKAKDINKENFDYISHALRCLNAYFQRKDECIKL